MIPSGMPDTLESLCLEFFINPRCPPSAPSDPPSTATIKEEPPASSPLAAIDGTDMPPEPPARTDGESNEAADG